MLILELLNVLMEFTILELMAIWQKAQTMDTHGVD